jgi:uncharacterized repeat protein (TIGR01451 family)
MPIWCSVYNAGTVRDTVAVHLDLDPGFTFISSVPPPSSSSGNNYTWELQDLQPFQTRTITMSVLAPGVAQIGDTLGCTLAAQSEVTSTTPGSSTQSWSEVLTCAFDPNEKQVEPEGNGVLHGIPVSTDSLIYTIHFQNTGTSTATNVVVEDVLDAHLDASTVEVLGTSHALGQVSISGNSAVFRFNNIMLPDSGADFPGSEGFVRFRVHLLPGAPDHTSVENSAAIFFDQNPPVVTNTVYNTLVDCSLYSADLLQPAPAVLSTSTPGTYQWYLNNEPVPGATNATLFAETNGSYTVEVHTAMGCTLHAGPVEVTAASIAEQSDMGQQALVIPNPAHDQARVVLQQALQPGTPLEVLDEQGRCVVHGSLPNGAEALIDIHALAPGVYAVCIAPNQREQVVLRLICY